MLNQQFKNIFIPQRKIGAALAYEVKMIYDSTDKKIQHKC